MRLTGLVGTNTRNPRKHSEKFLKNAKNKNLLKIKRILLRKYKLTGGPVFYFYPARGGVVPLCPLSVTPLPVIVNRFPA